MLFAFGLVILSALLFSGIDAAFCSGEISRFGSRSNGIVPATASASTQHLFKRDNGSGEHAAWYNHVVKQGVTLALPVAIMLSVVTATPIMIINPQPVQAASVATKEDISMLTNEIQSMFDTQEAEMKSMFDELDNKIDELGNRIDELGNIMFFGPIVSAVLSAGIAACINYQAILEVKKDTKEWAKEAVKELATRMATLGSAKEIHK